MTAPKRVKPDTEAFIVDTRKPEVVRLPAWSLKNRFEIPKGATHVCFKIAVKGARWMRDARGAPIPMFVVMIGRTPDEAIRKSETNIRRYIAQAERGVVQGNAKLTAVSALRGKS